MTKDSTGISDIIEFYTAVFQTFRAYQLLELCVWWMAYHHLFLMSLKCILNFPFCPALKVLAECFYGLGEVLIKIRESKIVLEGLHFHVRYPIT